MPKNAKLAVNSSKAYGFGSVIPFEPGSISFGSSGSFTLPDPTRTTQVVIDLYGGGGGGGGANFGGTYPNPNNNTAGGTSTVS